MLHCSQGFLPCQSVQNNGKGHKKELSKACEKKEDKVLRFRVFDIYEVCESRESWNFTPRALPAGAAMKQMFRFY